MGIKIGSLIGTPETSFNRIYLPAAPFVICNVIVMSLLLAFPELMNGVLAVIGRQ